MIIRVMAAATLATALMLPACQPSGCQKSGSGGDSHTIPGAVPACDTNPVAPKVITFAGKKSVQGSTESTCDLPPQEHHVQVFLEMKVAGQWAVQPDPAGKTAGNCLDIPANGLPKTCTWIITRCQTGTWRTRVVVFGHGPATEGYPNGIPFNFPKPGQPPVVSSEVRLTC